MSSSGTNHLLEALSPGSRALILSRAVEIDLPVRTMLQPQEERPRFAYFPTSGLASVVIALKDGGTSEVALVGHEGLVSASSLLGAAIPSTQCFMQVGGSGFRLPFAELQKLFCDSEEIRERILHFVQVQFLTTSQISACNTFHPMEARLARWLLMVQDRIGHDALHITHEFLGQMLGVHRPTVTITIASLEKAGLIENGRATVRILSREHLITAACDCYPITYNLLRNLYPAD